MGNKKIKESSSLLSSLKFPWRSGSISIFEIITPAGNIQPVNIILKMPEFYELPKVTLDDKPMCSAWNIDPVFWLVEPLQQNTFLSKNIY